MEGNTTSDNYNHLQEIMEENGTSDSDETSAANNGRKWHKW